MTDNNKVASGAVAAGASYPVSHVEWEVANGELSATFLQTLLAWSFKRFSEHYWLYEPTQGPAIGLLEKAAPQLLDKACPVFIQVPDMEACLLKAQSLNAEVVEQPVAIAAYGRWAKIKEPGGNIVGLFQKA